MPAYSDADQLARRVRGREFLADDRLARRSPGPPGRRTGPRSRDLRWCVARARRGIVRQPACKRYRYRQASVSTSGRPWWARPRSRSRSCSVAGCGWVPGKTRRSPRTARSSRPSRPGAGTRPRSSGATSSTRRTSASRSTASGSATSTGSSRDGAWTRAIIQARNDQAIAARRSPDGSPWQPRKQWDRFLSEVQDVHGRGLSRAARRGAPAGSTR